MCCYDCNTCYGISFFSIFFSPPFFSYFVFFFFFLIFIKTLLGGKGWGWKDGGKGGVFDDWGGSRIGDDVPILIAALIFVSLLSRILFNCSWYGFLKLELCFCSLLMRRFNGCILTSRAQFGVIRNALQQDLAFLLWSSGFWRTLLR